MPDQIFDYQFRLILIGDSTVGKSSLLRYFTEGSFGDSCEPTMGVDFYARLVDIKPGVRVKLQLWDTAGQERFRSITRSYYRNSVGVLLVYDITRPNSFEHVEDWLEESRVHILPHHPVYILVGHKADDEVGRKVPVREGRNFANNHGFQFFETSAISGKNVEEVFVSLASQIYSKVLSGEYSLSSGWEGVKEGAALLLSEPSSLTNSTVVSSDCGARKCC